MPQEINDLIKGHQKFRERYFQDDDNTTYEQLVKLGQRPKALVIACSDSRVDPSILMNCEPGDLFVIRNVANLVPPCENNAGYHGTSAAIEFAVQQLKLRHIIILGHSHCGGMRALVENADMNQTGFIHKWIELAQPAREEVMRNHPHSSVDVQTNICCQYAIQHSLKNLMTFPWIKERVETGDLFLHGWYFNLENGVINHFDAEKSCFKPLPNDSF